MSRITTDQLAELLAQDKAGRVTRENLQKFLLNPDGENPTVSSSVEDYEYENMVDSRYYLKKDGITTKNFPNSDTGYTVQLDYGKTVEEMVSAGRYDWKNDNITTKNFPVSGTGVVTVALELVHLDRRTSSKKVLAHLQAKGMRPATVEEFLAFGATFPEVQREFPVICLGSSWVDPDGDRYVPYLRRDGSRRLLGLNWFGDDWYGLCRFLAVRKSA